VRGLAADLVASRCDERAVRVSALGVDVLLVHQGVAGHITRRQGQLQINDVGNRNRIVATATDREDNHGNKGSANSHGLIVPPVCAGRKRGDVGVG
jgi:hypothetical protein